MRSLEIVIRAPVAKTRVSRTLPISPITAEKLRRLTSVRHEQWPDSVPVFCTENGQPMDTFIWNVRMRFYGKRLGARVRPYDLRHTFAVCYLRRGGNAFGLQRTLGHSTLVMTKRYVALTDRDLREQHKEASPLNGLMPGTRRVRKLREAVAGR